MDKIIHNYSLKNTFFMESLEKPSYEINIDWMWSQEGACGKPVCLFFVVWPVNPTLVRGPLSARDCVRQSIYWTVNNGRPDIGIRWLMAGQAHNGAAQLDLLQHAPQALAYAIRTYSAQFAVSEEKMIEFSPSEILSFPKQVNNLEPASWEDLMDIVEDVKPIEIAIPIDIK
ncbi:hypothetical protein WBJ53_14235 [Spirosoma sp. SC4-14]|uniref:hypothetical protein n=1 Tax=Spirosoma sp. SC4-14 TaxID=3128900 RepID=UPI0030D59EAF